MVRVLGCYLGDLEFKSPVSLAVHWVTLSHSLCLNLSSSAGKIKQGRENYVHHLGLLGRKSGYKSKEYIMKWDAHTSTNVSQISPHIPDNTNAL